MSVLTNIQAVRDAINLVIVDNVDEDITGLVLNVAMIDMLDTLEADLIARQIEVDLNTAKVSNVSHTGEVTGSGVLVVNPTAISRTLKKVVASDFIGGGGSGANLTTTQTATTVDVISDTGTDATLPQAIAGGNAGVMSGADKAVIDSTSGTNTGDEVVATTGEVDTGTDNIKYLSASALNGSAPTIKATNISELVDIYVVSVSAIAGDLAVDTTVDSLLIRYAGTITEVSGSVETAPTGAGIIIDIHKNGTTIMTTDKIVIDATEDDSKDSATQPTLTTTAIASGDKLSFDIDQIGSTITGAGGKVYVYIKRT